MNDKKLITSFIFIIIFSFSCLSIEANPINVDSEFSIITNDSWAVDDDHTEYPYRIVQIENKGEMLIFKSIIDQSDEITDNDDFKKAVQEVIDDIILTMPDARIMTNSGSSQDDHLNFVLEFDSYDTLTNHTIIHRVKSYIYRHPEGFQVLFSLWGRVISGSEDETMVDIKTFQDQFEYLGPATDYFYPKYNDLKWMSLYGAFLIMFFGIFALIKKGKKEKPTP